MGDWSALGEGGVFYEQRELYALSWGVDIHTSRVACAPFGGPVAVVRDDRKIVKSSGGQLRSGTVQIFNSAGTALGKFLWDRPSRLVAFSWTEDEVLLCVADDGGVYPYSVDGELLPWQTSLGAECAAQGVAEARVWAKGLVALTHAAQLFAVTDLAEPRVTRLEVPPLEAFPHAMAVIPPHCTSHGGLEVLLAVEQTIWTVQPSRAVDLRVQFGRVLRMEVTHNGALVALLAEGGRLWVLSPDLRTPLCECDAACGEPGGPDALLGLAWCGADAVALQWPEALQLVGPDGASLRFPTDADAPYALATECDGLRCLSQTQHSLLRRVPDPLARCLGVGSTAPGALLCDALEAFDRGSARADEALRSVGPQQLEEAWRDCCQAASHAWEPRQQRQLLRAAAFGAAHVPLAQRRAAISQAAGGAGGAYADAVRALRLLNAVRHHSLGGIPLSALQLQQLPGGAGALVGRLLSQRRHLHALRVSEFLGLPPARVLLHWAAQRMAGALALSDRQLLDCLMEKLRLCPGIPYGDIASEAFRRGRPRLAALLLDYEQRSGEQVPLLTSMGEDDRALAKAVESGDTDLMYLAVFHLYRKLPSFAAFAECVARRPEARKLFVAYCRRTDAELLKSFLYAAGDAQGTADAVLREALGGLRQGQLEAGTAGKLLEQAASLYAKCKLDAQAAQVGDAARLLKAQVELEYGEGRRGAAAAGARHKYVGSSLGGTLLTALAEGHPKTAAKLRADFRLGDRHWAWLRARAAASRRDWDALCLLAEEKRVPTGHAALVELALDAGAPRVELARLIARVGEPAARAEWYAAAGLAQQAASAQAEAAEAQGASYAKQAQNLFTQTWGRLTLG